MNDTVAEHKREVVVDQKMAHAHLVELKSGRPGPCFFLVPGTGGRVEGFAELATLLDTPMPVLAIEARGVDGNGQPDDDIETLIRHYIDRIRTQQPNGPYFLLGHSFGGMVVFEMAQRLLTMQERIACLILLDTPVPIRLWPLRFLLANFGSRLHGNLKRIVSSSIRESANYYTRRLILRWHGLHDIPEDLRFGQDGARMLLANEMLFKKWRPEFYPGRLTLFCASDTKDLDILWHNRVRELQTYSTEGDHIALIEQPYVSSLARDMSACLASASEACHLNLEGYVRSPTRELGVTKGDLT
ncbi:MAG: alpha/beta fold hydrolase [Roseiarcus sp.]